MNWTMLSAIGDILSSAAILVTLIYLAIQTRQSANATQANTRQAILTGDQQLLTLIVNNPDLYLARYKPNLTDDEKIRLGAYLVTFVRMRESNWLQYQNGVLDEATWGSYRNSIVPFLDGPRSRSWWQKYVRDQKAFHPEFISLVDALLANAPAQDQKFWLSAFD
jgi:hypothetical protein